MDEGKDSRKGGAKIAAVVLAVIAVLIFGFLFVTGRLTPGGDAPSGQKDYEAVKANKQALEEVVTDALDADTAKAVSEIRVNEINGEYSVSIRVVLAGGFYFPDVIEQTAQPFFDKAEELGLTVERYDVMEYSKGNTGDMENFISWRSKDGVTGIYSNDTGAEPIVEPGVTLDRLREIVG